MPAGNLVSLLTSAAVLSCLTYCSSLTAANWNLSFPIDRAVGVLTVSDFPIRDGHHLVFDQSFRSVCRAKGRVELSSDSFIGLEVSAKESHDLSFLVQLPPHALGSLKVSGVRLGKEHLAHITQLSSLRKLEFDQCTIEHDAFDGAPKMPELLSVSYRGKPDQGRLALSRWMASQPKTEIYHCSPHLGLGDVRALGDHRTLGSVIVQLDVDALQTIHCLAKFPALRELSIAVDEATSGTALNELGSLERLERLRWFYGKVPADVLRRIGSNLRLDRLVLFQVEPGEGFSEALESLSDLTELEITLAEDKQLDDLVTSLSRMPKLKFWPRITRVDSESLKQIVREQRIESLALLGVSKDVTPAQLFELNKLKRLKRLALVNVPVSDEWLKSLSGLNDLEYLNLFGTGVTGKEFGSLKRLPNLRDVRLFFENFNDAHVRPELSSLSFLPSLERLDVGGSHFRPEDVEPLRICKTLRSLRLWGGGLTDDSTAAWLSELRELKELELSDNCVVTDTGLLKLAEMPKLQKLTVSGFVTSTAVDHMMELPSLKQLVIDSSLIGESDSERLKSSSRISLFIRPFSGSVVKGADGLLRKPQTGAESIVTGTDGLKRRTDRRSDRSQLDSLEGKSPPAFDLDGSNAGSSIEWSELRGKVVVVDFWGTWCGPCRLQIPELQALHAKYHRHGLEIVGVHTSERAEDLDEYVKTKKLPWINAIDDEDKTAAAYNVKSFPSLFLIDRKGILRVALAHPLGLEEAVATLLNEPK